MQLHYGWQHCFDTKHVFNHHHDDTFFSEAFVNTQGKGGAHKPALKRKRGQHKRGDGADLTGEVESLEINEDSGGVRA